MLQAFLLWQEDIVILSMIYTYALAYARPRPYPIRHCQQGALNAIICILAKHLLDSTRSETSVVDYSSRPAQGVELQK